MTIDTTNMCSHLVLAGKSAPKIIREDSICELAVC